MNVNKRLLKFSLAPIIIGSMLLYLSVMGASGIGLSLTGSYWKEDFDNLTGWQIEYPGKNRISPPGQVQCWSPSGTDSYSRRSGMMSSNYYDAGGQYTVEFRMLLDKCGAQASQGFAIYDGDYWLPFGFNSTHIFEMGSGMWVALQYPGLLGSWHVWTLVCDRTNNKLDLYDGSTKVGANWVFVPASGLRAKVSIDGSGGILNTKGTIDIPNADDCNAYFDYVYVDSGLIPPAGGSSYSLNVAASCNGVSLPTSASVSFGGASGTSYSLPHTWTSTTSSSVTAIIASSYTYGGTTYTFDHWDNGGVSTSRSGTLSSTTTYWTGYYTAYTPPPNYYTVIVTTQDATSHAEFSGMPVTFNGVQKSSGSAQWNNIAAGSYSLSVPTSYNIGSTTYTFSSWKDSAMSSVSGNYYVSQTVTLTAYYTASGGDDGGWDPFAGVRSFLNSYTVRQYELIAGAVAVLASSVMILAALFVKKKTLSGLPLVG